MFKPKLKHVILVMCIAIMAFGVVAVAHAVRPDYPMMNYVPQNLGVYDTYYCNFKESDCRSCHGTTTAWRHHDTETARRGACCDCHKLNPGGCANPIPPERDCKVCHIDGGPLGDLGNPHHKSRYADAGSCTACHSSLLVSDLNTIDPPQYDPTNVTPTPYSCENCHWPNGAVAHSPAPLVDWNQWSSFPKPTTWPDSLAHPAPIEANGPVLTGALNPQRPFRPLDGTHHEINGVVYPNCYNCHGSNPDTDPSWDPDNPYLIRFCENCHDRYTLHDLGPSEEHTTAGIGGLGLFGGYTRGGLVNVYNQVVLQNEKCVACHMNIEPPLPMPVKPGVAPTIDYILPFTASPGAKVSIIHAGAAPDFGDLGPDDQVQMFNGAWVNMPVVSWTKNKIEFTVDGWTFTPNTWNGVRVAKGYWAENIGAPGGDNDGFCEAGEVCDQTFQVSNAPAPGFFVRKHPVLTSLSPDSGTWGTGPGSTIITINAVAGSFFTNRESYGTITLDPGEPRIGYSTYVELVASNDRYRVTEMTGSGWAGDAGLGAWSDTALKIRLAKISVGGNIVGNLLDVNTNNPVPLADLYKGNWQLYVITDYFKDDGAVANVHMLRHASGHLTGKLDNDTLIYREISDPLPFFATDTPFISSIGPSSLKGGNLAAVYGINFGTTQDTSTIFAQACSGVGPVYSLAVFQWANDRVVFRTPVIVPPQKTGCVKVRVPKVLPPGSIDSNFSPAITVTP